jgi:hypothetical protein
VGKCLHKALTQCSKEKNTPALLSQRINVVEGPLFEEDGTDRHAHQLLHEIRRAMEEGDIVVLVNLEFLYESLYDVLNKSYTQLGTALYTRIAVGRHSESCVVHPNFKVTNKDRNSCCCCH